MTQLTPPSRRSVLAGASATAAGVVVGGPAEAAAPCVACAHPGTVVEFLARITQGGEAFTSLGFLTAARGAAASDLFAGSPPSVSTALFTARADGALRARVQDQSVHSLDIVGRLSVYQRSTPGADWADPDSFSAGTLVARYALTLQDMLAVFAPGQGLPTLSGDMLQTIARPLGGGLAGATFGQRGTRLRMLATGIGQLIDPATLHAELEIAGNWAGE